MATAPGVGGKIALALAAPHNRPPKYGRQHLIDKSFCFFFQKETLA
jgi:hypothetical protein